MDGVDTLQQQDRDRAIALVLASVYVCLWTMTRVARGNGHVPRTWTQYRSHTCTIKLCVLFTGIAAADELYRS